MGGALGSPIDEAKQARIQELLKNTMLTFTTQFPIAYKNALIAQVKADSDSATPDALETKELDSAADPSYIIKEGKVVKDGSTGGHWKERFLVAYNKSDNFCLRYFDGEDSTGVEKGKINTAGFYARHFDKEDKAKLECDHGVKLVPYFSKDRTYNFKCSSAEDANDWYSTLRTCCRGAGPPLDPNPIIANAFKETMIKVRHAAGVHSSSSCYYDEPETLSNFIYELVHNEVLKEAYAAVPETGRDMAVSMADKMVIAGIKTACKAGWLSARTAADSATQSITDAVTPAMQQLTDAEDTMMTSVNSLLSKSAGAAIQTLSAKFLPGPVRLLKVYAKGAVLGACKGFGEKIKEVRSKLDGKDKAAGMKILIQMEKQVWFQNSGCLKECYSQADKVYDALAGESVFEGGMDRWDVYWCVRDSAVALYRNAVATFFNKYFEAIEAGAVNVDALVMEVTLMCAHDAALVSQDIFYTVFTTMIAQNPEWRENVIVPLEKGTEPLQTQIDAIPVVSSFIDLASMVDRALEGSLRNLVRPAIDEACTGLIDTTDLIKEM
jgi:hypothetical protein